MDDRHVVALAAATALGCWLALAVPWWVVVIAIGATAFWNAPWRWPRSLLCCLASALLGSALAAHWWGELAQPLPGDVAGIATVTRDPEMMFGTARLEVKLHDRRWQVLANKASTPVLERLAAGDRVYISGYTEDLSGAAMPSLRRRHIAGRINVLEAHLAERAGRLDAVANGLRSTLHGGASALTDEQRALFTGLVYGDDRAQEDQVTEDFRAAGLAHLTAVSGQNVLFVLLVCSPVLGRLRLGWRFVGGLFVLLLFGVMTRWEPSVVRAEAMAAVVLLASYLGRPVSLWRTLGLAITGSLLFDPFLVGSIGFLLSVGACCGMALLGQPISDALRGPMWLRRSLGFSAAAQLGVAPVHMAVFGPMPVVALLANLLAEPAAAAVMMWGLVAGLVAGVVGSPLATVLHVPTAALLDWLLAVAHYGARSPTGWWTTDRLALLALGTTLLWWWRRRPGRLPSTE